MASSPDKVPLSYRVTHQYYIVPDTLDQIRRKENALAVQHDPYDYLMSNWDRQMAKQLPIRMFCVGLAVGASSLYHISRTHEMNRLRRLQFSYDLMFNLAGRAVLAGLAGEVISRKLFVNYDRV